MGKGPRTINYDVNCNVFLFKIALYIELITAAIEIPINRPWIISYLVLPILGKLYTVSPSLRAVCPLTHPIE